MNRSCFLRLAVAAVSALPLGLPPTPAYAQILPQNFTDDFVALVAGDGSLDVEFLPDGRAVIAVQVTQTLELYRPGFAATSLIGTVEGVSGTGEAGLLGVAVDSRWPVEPYFYVHYTRADQTIRVTRYRAIGDPNDPQGLLTMENPYHVLTGLPHLQLHHNAGGMEFGTDGMLYVSLGDDGPDCAGQDSTTLTACILRLNVSALPDTGSGPPDRALLVPADNPHVGAGGDLELVYCHGLRNPFRFSLDPANGKLYVGDVGWDQFEEISEGVGGDNFGWGYREGFLVREPVGPCSEPGGPGSQTWYDNPIYAYPHDMESGIPNATFSAAIICGPIYHAQGGVYDFPPAYEGALFFGDFPKQITRVLVPDGGGWALMDSVAGQPTAEDWARNLGKIPDYEVGPDGGLYYLRYFFGGPGELRRISYHAPLSSEAEVPVPLPLRVFPNPAAFGAVHLRWDEAPTSIEVYDLLGRRVASLRAEDSGESGLSWDRRDDGGKPVPPGVYWIRGVFERDTVSRRIVLL